MLATFNVILRKQIQNDMIAVLHYYVWLLGKQKADLTEQQATLVQIKKVEGATIGKELSQNEEEFGRLYTAAQILLRDMTGTAGDAYFTEMIGDRKTKEWQTNYRQHMIDTSMILINECNNKFETIPQFAKLKNKLEAAFRNLS